MKSKALPAALFVNALLATAAVDYASGISGDPLTGLAAGAGVVCGTLFGVWLATRKPLDR
jgi:uncharacterized membrane protein YfcA